MEKIRIVVATRMRYDEFMNLSATGRTLRYSIYPGIELIVTSENKLGLSAVYNQVLDHSLNDPAILVFVHDDVHFIDYYWCYHLLDALKQYDVVGVVGNIRRLPGQVSWAFKSDKFDWDEKSNLSGSVGHGKSFPPQMLSRFGAPRQAVKLIDGLFIAARSEVLHSHRIRFDEMFDFHFYDMDFCRQVELASLRCGTWDIPLIHESVGSFGTNGWRTGLECYRRKWESMRISS